MSPWRARGIWLLHLLSMLYLLLGWSLPWTWALWLACIVYPLVLIQWWWLDDRCFLTIVEERLRDEREEAPAAEELHFVSVLLSRLLGRPVSRACGDALSRAVVWGGFAIASLRLYSRYA